MPQVWKIPHPKDHSLSRAGQQGARLASICRPVRRSEADSSSFHLTGLQATAPRAAGTRPWPGLLAPLTVFTQGHSQSGPSATWLCVLMEQPGFQCRSLFSRINFLRMYFLLATLHLPCCMRAFSGRDEQDCSLVVMRGLLIAAASSRSLGSTRARVAALGSKTWAQ